MALSRLAQEFAAEISLHDWSDAPYRADKAGHQARWDHGRSNHKILDPGETECVRLNVMWVAAQVLRHSDPNFDVYEFAEACGINTAPLGRAIAYGLRCASEAYDRPGTFDASDDPSARVAGDRETSR